MKKILFAVLALSSVNAFAEQTNCKNITFATDIDFSDYRSYDFVNTMRADLEAKGYKLYRNTSNNEGSRQSTLVPGFNIILSNEIKTSTLVYTSCSVSINLVKKDNADTSWFDLKSFSINGMTEFSGESGGASVFRGTTCREALMEALAEIPSCGSATVRY